MKTFEKKQTRSQSTNKVAIHGLKNFLLNHKYKHIDCAENSDNIYTLHTFMLPLALLSNQKVAAPEKEMKEA